MMRREDETMKETKAMNSILVGLLLMVAVEAQAVDYKSTYKGSRVQPLASNQPVRTRDNGLRKRAQLRCSIATER